MTSVARALAWEFWRPHRWGLIAIPGYLLALAAFNLLILPPGRSVNPVDSVRFAFTVNVPVCAAVFYLIAVFSHGLGGDVAARQSMYPARLFTLPVSTAALAGWPMLFGMTAVATLWVATALIGLWPVGARLPLVWPALFLAAMLAWIQVFTWLPYGVRGARVIVAVLWLMVGDVVAILALYQKTPEPLMIALLAPQLPFAWFAARYAVARARRGDVPDWRTVYARRAGARSQTLRPFASAAQAQAWFERSRYARSLPAVVAILLPFEIAFLYLVRALPSLVWFTLVGMLITPPFLAIFAAAGVRRSTPDGSDAYQLSPFVATRPASSAALVAARLHAALWSTLAAWLLVLVAMPIGLVLSDTAPMVTRSLHRFAAWLGGPRAVVVALLFSAALLASTWKQLVQGLFVGLSGRAWLVKGSVFGTLAALIILGPMLDRLIGSGQAITVLWDALPLVLWVLVTIKMSAAAYVAARLHRRRLLSDRTLVLLAAGWATLVLALHGVLVWLLSSATFPNYLFLLSAILAVPLTRVGAAPLALAANRHR